jgi:hypothetical protein
MRWFEKSNIPVIRFRQRSIGVLEQWSVEINMSSLQRSITPFPE